MHRVLGPAELMSAFGGKADLAQLANYDRMSAFDAVDGACPAASKCHRLVASKPERFKGGEAR